MPTMSVPGGVLLDTCRFPTTAKGYRDLLAWTRVFGLVHRAGVECTSSYDAALARYLHTEALAVSEVNRTERGDRRRRAKSDTIDAEAAARAVLSRRATVIAKSGDGQVEMVRMLKLVKPQPSNPMGRIHQLKAVLARAAGLWSVKWCVGGGGRR